MKNVSVKIIYVLLMFSPLGFLVGYEKQKWVDLLFQSNRLMKCVKTHVKSNEMVLNSCGISPPGGAFLTFMRVLRNY